MICLENTENIAPVSLVERVSSGNNHRAIELPSDSLLWVRADARQFMFLGPVDPNLCCQAWISASSPEAELAITADESCMQAPKTGHLVEGEQTENGVHLDE